VRTIPVKPFVELRHRRFVEPRAFFAALEENCSQPVDFVDGVVFGPDELVLTTGRFTDSAPYSSDYTFENIFYRSLRERDLDYLGTRDFLWRWGHRLVLVLEECRRAGSVDPPALRSRAPRLAHVSEDHALEQPLGHHARACPAARPADRIGHTGRRHSDRARGRVPRILPARHPDRARMDLPDPSFCAGRSLLPVSAAARCALCQFGFWDVVRTSGEHSPGFFNRLVEHEVEALGGIKSLYSDSYYSRERFWRTYGGAGYRALKTRYDPQGMFPDLYEKCVLRH
jgi:hypothetical protein